MTLGVITIRMITNPNRHWLEILERKQEAIHSKLFKKFLSPYMSMSEATHKSLEAPSTQIVTLHVVTERLVTIVLNNPVCGVRI